ncbi:unnamed protein product [Mycena citricolor]|uniref:cAMP-independent regulatory protein pac2 n=1 Tax=Mycena citricolor TaxID=2018698 RepID=A0AAD2GWT6_9AGAR|nr:unnamed protein product [Mycena citricolor]
MQGPTCTNLRIRSPADVRIIFHAVLLDILPMVTRRLDSEERGLIVPGSVYVWEERGTTSEITGVGIERWTDGIRWGPSRVREGFLFYHEKPTTHYVFPGGMYPSHRQHNTSSLLCKQTFTAFVETPRGQRKWHLIAYFTEDSIERLHCIDDYPTLACKSRPPLGPVLEFIIALKRYTCRTENTRAHGLSRGGQTTYSIRTTRVQRRQSARSTCECRRRKSTTLIPHQYHRPGICRGR